MADDNRASFEAWVRSFCERTEDADALLSFTNGCYDDEQTQYKFVGWCAARHQPNGGDGVVYTVNGQIPISSGAGAYSIKTEVGVLPCSLAVAAEWDKREEYIREPEALLSPKTMTPKELAKRLKRGEKWTVAGAEELRQNLQGCMEALQSHAPDCLEVEAANIALAKGAGAEDARDAAWRHVIWQSEFNKWRSVPGTYTEKECGKRADEYVESMARRVDAAMADQNKGKV